LPVLAEAPEHGVATAYRVRVVEPQLARLSDEGAVAGYVGGRSPGSAAGRYGRGWMRPEKYVAETGRRDRKCHHESILRARSDSRCSTTKFSH
jgi:hypothetical protein